MKNKVIACVGILVIIILGVFGFIFLNKPKSNPVNNDLVITGDINYEGTINGSNYVSVQKFSVKSLKEQEEVYELTIDGKIDNDLKDKVSLLAFKTTKPDEEYININDNNMEVVGNLKVVYGSANLTNNKIKIDQEFLSKDKEEVTYYIVYRYNNKEVNGKYVVNANFNKVEQYNIDKVTIKTLCDEVTNMSLLNKDDRLYNIPVPENHGEFKGWMVEDKDLDINEIVSEEITYIPKFN